MAKRAGFVLIGQWQKKSADKRKTLRPCQSLSLSGEVARRSRDGEGRFRDEPSQSRCARQLSRRESPWQRGQVSSSLVNGRRSQPISGKRSAFAKASPFRERWHGEAVTERVDPSSGPAERPACSVKLRRGKKQERSTSRPRQNHNGRSTAGVSPCQRETILLKRKKNALFYKMEKATYHSPKNEQKNLVHVHKKTTLV